MLAEDQIQFTIIDSGSITTVSTYTNEFRNLMVLLNNHIYLENFGECGGMGRCSTCVVKLHGVNYRPELERNESATLQKNGLLQKGFRLACQLSVTKALQHAIVEIANGLV